MAELATTTAASVFNHVYHLQKPDYARDVTETSHTAFVFVLLTGSTGTNTESRVIEELWRELATRFGHVKFCQMRADMCIEGYPDRNCPTLLVYRDGDIRRQIVTLKELGGVRTKIAGTLSLFLRSTVNACCHDRVGICSSSSSIAFGVQHQHHHAHRVAGSCCPHQAEAQDCSMLRIARCSEFLDLLESLCAWATTTGSSQATSTQPSASWAICTHNPVCPV